MIREEVVTSAVSFLRDPAVASSPLSRRLDFLRSKRLIPEEIDAALARAGQQPPSGSQISGSTPFGTSHPYHNAGALQQARPYSPFEDGNRQAQQLPHRDWRDWFIMATVTGGLTYGCYMLAKRYVYPLIAPPTPPQLEQDKTAIDESFAKAFALLDQLAADTEALKVSEEARTYRIDTALSEVETVLGELRDGKTRREEEARRTNEDLRGLKELIQKSLSTQKESTDGRLQDLNKELKGLKTLVSNRVASNAGPASGSRTTTEDQSQQGPSTDSKRQGLASSVDDQTASSTPSATSAAAPQESTVASQTDRPTSGSSSATGSGDTNHNLSRLLRAGIPVDRAAIPAWQLAAANQDAKSGSEAGNAGRS